MRQSNQKIIQHYQQGEYRQGIILAEEALELAQNLWGEVHSHVASSMNNLALLYNSLGRHSEAEPLYVDALAMTKRLFGDIHPHVASSMNNLAALYDSLGRHSDAEPLLVDALAMRKKLFGGIHPDVATSMNNLASLYQSLGRDWEAKPLYVDALAMTKRLFGDIHPDVASSMNNLASLYKSLGRHSEAEPLYVNALAMRKKLFGGIHPSVATSMNNLASLYNSLGRHSEAESLLVDTLAIWKKLFGDIHPSVATTMNNLASLYHSLGRHSEAEPLYVDALAMWKKLFGDIYPHVASSMNNLATLFAATDRYPEALDLMKQAITIENRLISQAFSYSCESDRLAYLQTIRNNFDGFLSLITQHLPHSPKAKQAALDVILQRKAITAAALAAQNQALSSGRYPHLQPQLNELRKLSDQISHYIYHQPQPELIPQLQKDYNNLQKKLAAEIPEIRLQDQTIDHHAVALALPPDSILIEFVCFKVFDFHVAKESQGQRTRYLAFILPGGQPNKIEMIDLGEAEPINQLIHQFRQYVSDSNLAIHSLDMGGDSADDEELTHLPPAANELREKIFDPLRPYLNLSQPGKTPTLQIAPDGNLNLVPFQILPLDETGQQLLMDEYCISYLSVGRDALRSKIKIERPASVPLVIADPDFNLSVATLATDGVTDVADGEVVGELVQTLAGSIFQQTTGTRFLGESVANLLKVSPYLDKNALASHLTNCQSPEILLIATHGYFNPEKPLQDYLKFILALIDCRNGEEEKLIQQHRNLIDPTLLEIIEQVITISTKKGYQNLAHRLKTLTQHLTPKPKIPNPDSPIQNPKSKIQNSPDPMLCSALAFAGANTWLLGKRLPKPAGKGMVFAQDIAALDLWATELAVLSACQTGIGDIKLGEGVFGLRRAFAAAGAKTLLISLWSVPDRATALLMDRFFSNLHQGLGRAAALEDAQNYIRTITVKELQQFPLGQHVLEELNTVIAHSNDINPQNNNFSQEDTPLAHPYFWGAWVCQGDTTPMTLSINTAIQFEV